MRLDRNKVPVSRWRTPIRSYLPQWKTMKVVSSITDLVHDCKLSMVAQNAEDLTYMLDEGRYVV